MPTTPEMFSTVTLRKCSNAQDIPKKNLCYVTLALNMPMPTPCFLVLVTLRSDSCPNVAYTTVIRFYNFRGELTDISATQASLNFMSVMQLAEAEAAALASQSRCSTLQQDLVAVHTRLKASEDVVKSLTWQIKMSSDPTPAAPSSGAEEWMNTFLGCRPTPRR